MTDIKKSRGEIEVVPPGGQTGFVLADAAGFGKADRVGNSADVTLRCQDVRNSIVT